MKRGPFAAVISISLMAAVCLLGCSSSNAPQSGLAAEIDSACGGADWRRRIWHLSNAGMCGSNRNPSVDESLMAYAGIGWKF